jgi:DNA invertase Pin-like site-specific DNA recombinase
MTPRGSAISAGIKRAQAAGKRVGSPPKPFDLERARELRARGLSYRSIGAELGVPRSRDSVRSGGRAG